MGISEFLVSSWTGFVGNFFFLGTLFLVGCVLKYLPRRRRLRRFFLRAAKQPIYIILSHVRVAAGGAVGVSGDRYSFMSSAIPLMEAQVAQRFKGSFLSPIPGLAGQPGLLSSLLVREFAVEIAPSPLTVAEIPMNGTLIAVGSAAFNSASALIEQNFVPPARFHANNGGIVFASGAGSVDPAVGFISKLLDAANGRFIFYVAGPSEEATAAALQYLLEHWLELERRYENQESFAVAIRVVSTLPLQGRVEFYDQ